MDSPRELQHIARTLRRRMSLPEVLLWRAIKGRKLDGLHFRRQHPLGAYVLDFYCDEVRLAIEVDGASHGLGDRAAKDARRDAWLAEKGIRTLRLPARVILDEVDNATRTILREARGEFDAPPLGELPRSG